MRYIILKHNLTNTQSMPLLSHAWHSGDIAALGDLINGGRSSILRIEWILFPFSSPLRRWCLMCRFITLWSIFCFLLPLPPSIIFVLARVSRIELSSAMNTKDFAPPVMVCWLEKPIHNCAVLFRSSDFIFIIKLIEIFHPLFFLYLQEKMILWHF